MNRRVLLLCLLAVTPLTARPPKFDPTAVDSAVAASLKEWSVPGVAVVIVRDGKVIHLKGYGVKRVGKDDPVTADTLFPLASCTKAFTTAAVAALVDDDRMGWDDPVRRHLPTFRLSDPAADQLVTVRDLFSHRSGLGPHDLLWYRAAWDLEETVRRIPKLPLSYPFRGGYQYSSVPVLAGSFAAVNRYGGTWEELVREKVCTPLGMTGVAFTSKQAAGVADRAAGHRRTAAGKVEPMPEYEMAEPNPTGSMFATARGLAPWLTLHLADGAWNGKPLISAKNLGETKQPHIPIRMDAATKAVHPDTRQMSYAMGWVVYDHRGELVVAHGGVIDGFRVHVALLPDHRTGFALLNNLHQTKMNLALGNTLIDRLLGLPPKEWDAIIGKADADEAAAKAAAKAKRDGERRADRKPSHPLDRFAGGYADEAYGDAGVTAVGGGLELRFSSFRITLEHWDGDTFRVGGGQFDDDLVEFTSTAGGVSAVRIRGIEFRRK